MFRKKRRDGQYILDIRASFGNIGILRENNTRRIWENLYDIYSGSTPTITLSARAFYARRTNVRGMRETPPKHIKMEQPPATLTISSSSGDDSLDLRGQHCTFE
ncbi:hypothetical protein BC937DRAFT_92080 [Endogone sp. FLAS-F59071]|nr:hypothetical protein BC937DRAFT_93366 [Endogone sp. FLAS-F59071]RUS15729.1 hypothetical protein BC937DRAFT_92080 [Endogone sp. FLAS-F59071]|eukprot:RUS14772.1 hypothetical protein BC937DRAFT_93366 [Endogone sp. FLAS-F59071]